MADRVGQQLGNYQLLRLLGRGAFAEVYLAEHQYLEIPAAIKVLHVQMQPETQEAFRREARTIAHLQHSHIVRVLEFGIQDHTPFFVMEYTPNGTLRTRHPKGSRLPPEQIVRYVKQIAPALDYAHQQRVIHRDIKPENLLLNANNEIALSDFGLAVVQRSLDSLSTQNPAGTPLYMAPEQIRGKPDAASDQYSLAVVVYEWLCGEPPFRGSLFEVYSQHLYQPPPCLRTRLPDLSPAVEEVVLAALAKEPQERFATITAFATTLEEAILPEGSVHENQQMPAWVPLQRASAYIGRLHRNPLMGRDQEREILHHILLETEQDTRHPYVDHTTAALSGYMPPRSSCVLLFGEAGIGKTRLAEELSREAQERGWTVIWSKVYAQENTIPYRLWIEVLRHVMAQDSMAQQDVSRRPFLYRPLTSLLPELADLLPQGAVSTSWSPERVQLQIWEATLALLRAVSVRTPLLIVLDDVHWADGSSSTLLGYLVRRFAGHPILLVGTGRETELTSRQPLRHLLADLQREQLVTTVQVPALTDAQIGALVAHVPEPFVERIQSQAAGNPFFAEELARLASDEAVTRNKEIVSLKRHNRSSLPETIAAVLDLRLGRLSRACQQFLSNAAVLGGSFTFAAICLMEISKSRPVDEDNMLTLLEEALQAGVLTEEGAGTHITYHFWHPLFVSHLYEGLSAVRRASLHRRAAEVLRQLYQGREEEGAAAIANHLVKGGAEPTQIAHYAELAGDRAYSLSAYPEAEKHYRLAIEHIGTLSADESIEERLHLAYLLERLGECTLIQGNDEEARGLYEQVLQIRSQQRHFSSDAQYQHEAQIQALLWGEIGRTWYDTSDNAQAQQYFERGEQVLREAKVMAGPAWARLHFQQSYNFWQMGNFEKALKSARQALKLFEEVLQHRSGSNSSHSTHTRRTLEGDPVDLGRTHRLLGALAADIGQLSDALAHFNTALPVFEQHDRKREIGFVCSDIGYAHLMKAEYTLAQAAFRRSLRLAELIGDIPLMSLVFSNSGELAARTGDLVEAENWFKRCIALAEQVNDHIYVSLWSTALTLVLKDQGKLAEANGSLRRALAIGRAMHMIPCTGLVLLALGQLRIAQAIIDEANSVCLLRRAQSTLQRALTLEGLEVEVRTDGQLTLAQVFLMLGELETARQQVASIMEEAHNSELKRLIARAQRLLGSILAVQGQQKQAYAYFEQALQFFRDSGMRLEYARSLQAYGTALLQDEEAGETHHEQGLTYLQEARQAFEQCNAVLDFQAVERILSTQM